MLPGLKFKPETPPLKFKEVKAKRKKVKSRAERERARKSERLERQLKREARLERRAARREEEKKRRAERGEPQSTKTRTKRDPKNHHGTESVDITILKLLGKSQKSKKVAGKGKADRVEKKNVGTQKRLEGTKWKPGMRSEPREGWQEERRLKQQAKVESSYKKKQPTGPTTSMTSDDSWMTQLARDMVSDLVTNLPVNGDREVPKTSGVGLVLKDLGSDFEADLHWDPHKAAGSYSQQTLPDFPPTPSLFSDVPPSPTFHPEASTSIPPSPTFHPETTTSIPPMPPCMEFYQVRRK